MPATLQECIDNIISSLQEMKELIDIKDRDKSTLDQADDFDELIALLKSDEWPDAVNKHLICDPDNIDDKKARGNGIIELMIGGDLKGLKFLDFGCGEGYSTKVASEKNVLKAIGYDIKADSNWQNSENLTYTSDWQSVVNNGPYDSILCFDVIDHSSKKDILHKLKSVLSENGKIYLRAHPWVSRHANHFYHVLNKAYLHLVFTEEELKSIEDSWGKHDLFEPNIGIVYPIRTYTDMVKEADLHVEYMRESKEEVEDFFKMPKIANRIMKRTGMAEFPSFQMSLQFIDFCVAHKK